MLVNGGGDYSKMKHMFDGYACVTKVKVSGGKAWGSQRYLGTQAYTSYKQQGETRRLVGREWGLGGIECITSSVNSQPMQLAVIGMPCVQLVSLNAVSQLSYTEMTTGHQQLWGVVHSA
jgi:hypothetical protein